MVLLPALLLAADLGVGLVTEHWVDPAIPYTLKAQYSNIGPDTATGVVITIDLPAEVTVEQKPDACTVAGSRITCSVGTVPVSGHGFYPIAGELPFVVRAADLRDGATLNHTAAIKGNEPDSYKGNDTYVWPSLLYQTWVVDNTNDSGSGSLRAAMEAANAGCWGGFPCKIAFRFPQVGAGGFVTIAPESPLPVLTAVNIAVDATTQTRMFGDTNPAGPEVFLDGSKLTDGNGFVLAGPCDADVRGFAIGNFPQNGVLVQPSARCFAKFFYSGRHVRESYIGTDPTGAHAAPNTRGVFIDDRRGNGEEYVAPMNVDHNVISSNRRSGVFIQRGPYTQVNANVIGLSPQHDAPLGNGASGIYVGEEGEFTDIFANYIAFNGDFGVAIDRNAQAVAIHPNSIFANWQIGIDVGLDGPTPQSGTPAPEILSATYDAASNTTSIVATFHDDVPTVTGPTLHFYAADAPHRSGYGDGQYYLGTARPIERRGYVRFDAAGDWRGKWVCATMSHNSYYGFLTVGPASELPDTHTTTSEFSHTVEVK